MLFLLRWARRFHRWIAYGVGVVVALWVVSGIFMVLPAGPPIARTPQVTLDPAAATRTPAEAVGALGGTPGRRVRGAELRDLGGRLVYRFSMASGRYAFVDAATAQTLEFSDSLARALARYASIDVGHAATLSRITRYDRLYRNGALPAFRIELHDARGTLVHVAADGTVSESGKRSRLRALMGGLHEFQLPGIRLPDRARKALLIGVSVLTIVLVCTGYFLVLPPPRRG